MPWGYDERPRIGRTGMPEYLRDVRQPRRMEQRDLGQTHEAPFVRIINSDRTKNLEDEDVDEVVPVRRARAHSFSSVLL